MKRSTWITLVDVLAFIAFVFLITTGFLLKYVLPPGSGSAMGPGTGWRAASRPVSLVWGMTRHEWGDVHFWLAVFFLSVIALHLLIHWKWIVVSFKGRDRVQSSLQAALGVAALLGIVVLAAAPLLASKVTVERRQLWTNSAPAQIEGGQGRGWRKQLSSEPQAGANLQTEGGEDVRHNASTD